MAHFGVNQTAAAAGACAARVCVTRIATMAPRSTTRKKKAEQVPKPQKAAKKKRLVEKLVDAEAQVAGEGESVENRNRIRHGH